MPRDLAVTEDPAAGFDLVLRPGRGRRQPPVWIASPRRPATGARPLAVIHGISRDAGGIAARLAPRAAAQGRVLIAPLFTAEDFPRYQRAACGRRSDRALLTLLDWLAAEGSIAPGAVDLAGYSGGAQFAHRFTWMHPNRVARLTVAAAGWWTFPEAAPFPRGFGPADAAPAEAARWLRANLRAFLDREIAVAVGRLDDAPDRTTRSSPEIDARQGPDRLTRARRWTLAMRAAALRLALSRRPTLSVLPGCGHDFHACADAGLDRLILPDAPCAAGRPEASERRTPA